MGCRPPCLLEETDKIGRVFIVLVAADGRRFRLPVDYVNVQVYEPGREIVITTRGGATIHATTQATKWKFKRK